MSNVVDVSSDDWAFVDWTLLSIAKQCEATADFLPKGRQRAGLARRAKRARRVRQKLRQKIELSLR